MRRLVIQIIVVSAVFAGGIAVGSLWQARKTRISTPPTLPPLARPSEEKPLPLTKQLVTRSLQTQIFRTDKLRTTNQDVVWRWLKESIANYPQSWVKLDVWNEHSYGVVLYPPQILEPGELTQCNRELTSKSLPTLRPDKRYIPVQVTIDDLICPSWHGFIDTEQARLVFFVGVSG